MLYGPGKGLSKARYKALIHLCNIGLIGTVQCPVRWIGLKVVSIDRSLLKGDARRFS